MTTFLLRSTNLDAISEALETETVDGIVYDKLLNIDTAKELADKLKYRPTNLLFTYAFDKSVVDFLSGRLMYYSVMLPMSDNLSAFKYLNCRGQCLINCVELHQICMSNIRQFDHIMIPYNAAMQWRYDDYAVKNTRAHKRNNEVRLLGSTEVQEFAHMSVSELIGQALKIHDSVIISDVKSIDQLKDILYITAFDNTVISHVVITYDMWRKMRFNPMTEQLYEDTKKVGGSCANIYKV